MISSTKKLTNLEEYNWGLGIEHEMHIFHRPIISFEKKPKKKNEPVKDFILFDSYSVTQRLIDARQNGKLNIDDNDYEFLKSIPFETSGRLCNEKWVIKKVPYKMPEFVTFEPFCSIKKKRDLLNMSGEIQYLRKKFYNLLMLDKNTQKLVKKYGDFMEYPFGMTRYLKCPISSNKGIYKFEPKLRPEYNGSYHITMTLPYKEDITNNEFIKMHQNFANQLQWLEPLMLSSFFTGDEYAPGSLKKRVRGSFRVMIIGWGNLAGSDVRLFDKGIGRYAKTKTFWRDGLDLEDVDKLKPCYAPSPSALKEKAITSLSSDFRTFGSTDPNRPEHRESGIGMTKPNGIEFRIFDHFPDLYINHLMKLISLVAENSRIFQTKGYVYENKVWIEALHQIMKYGYRAELSNKYVKLLREKLGLKIKTSSIIAFDIFQEIMNELYAKNNYNGWSNIFNSAKLDPALNINYAKLPELNKKGWQFAFMIKANRNKKIMDKFNFLAKYLNYVKTISFKDFKTAVIDIFGNNWVNDVDDFAYFLETLQFAKLTKQKNGIISKINIVNQIQINKNFNKIMNFYLPQEATGIFV